MMRSFLKRLSKVIASEPASDEKVAPASGGKATTKPTPASLVKENFAKKKNSEMTSENESPSTEKTPVMGSPEKQTPAKGTSASEASVKPSSEKEESMQEAPAKEERVETNPDLQPICFFFEAHQPNRLKRYSFFHIGNDPFYEDDELNLELLNDACEKCYLPTNKLMTELIEEGRGQFKISLSVSGTLLEQLEKNRPDVLESFQKLHATGGVEIVAETYYHSLGFHRSKKEFAAQVELQMAKVKEVFGATPKVFRHTACVYYNELAAYVEGLGFESMLGEAVGRILNGREANYLYRSPNCKTIKTHLRNGILTDDIAFRFGNHDWPQHPLMAETFADWCLGNGGEVINLFMDYESIGSYQGVETGIFDFFKAFPKAWEDLGGRFLTISEAANEFEVVGEYDCHEPTSWAHQDKDLSAWKGNVMQEEARRKILVIEDLVKSKDCPELLHQWRKMQTAEHFYYMSTVGGEIGKVHDKLRPHKTPYDSYLYFMNALSDIQLRLEYECPPKECS